MTRWSTLARLGLLTTLLAGCATLAPPDDPPPDEPEHEEQDRGPDEPPDLSHLEDPEPRDEPLSPYGNPANYEVFGQTYRVMDLEEAEGFAEEGIASWYGKKFDGRRTSSGEPYDMYQLTAAHRQLPLPTYVRVTNRDNGKSVVVRVNDRGPFADDRIIDLSYAAADRIDMLDSGTAPVRIEALSLAFDPEAPRDQDAPPADTDRAETEPVAGDESGAEAYSMELRDPAPGASKAGSYLQVGAFAEQANADRLAQRLETEGLGPVRIAEGDDAYYRVHVGPLDGEAAVDARRRDLEAHGLSAQEVNGQRE